MVSAIGQVGMAALPLTMLWLLALSTGALGEATYTLPVGLAALAAGGICLSRAAVRDRWALVALLACVVFVPSINFRVREIGQPGLDWQNGIKIMVWLAMGAVCAVNWRRFEGLLSDPILAGLCGFGGVALFSATYSAVPAYTAACAFGFLMYLMFACLLAVTLDERTIVMTVVWTMALYSVLAWVAAVIVPDIAFLAPYGDKQINRLAGFAGHPNQLGQHTAVFLCMVLMARSRAYMGRWAGGALLSLGIVTLVATNSRTAIGAVAVAWLLEKVRSRGMALPALLLAGFLLAAAVVARGTGALPDVNTLLDATSRTGDAGEVLTLTGRTELWSFVWEKILDRPLLGYGFNSTEAVLALDWYGNADAGTGAHNTILQSLFTVGIIGTVPLVIALFLAVYRWLVYCGGPSNYLTPFLLVTGMTEVEIAVVPVLLSLTVFCRFAIDAADLRRHAIPRTYPPGS